MHFSRYLFLGIVVPLCITLYIVSFVSPVTALASERMSMTLTPPLYQVSLAKGAEWKSTLRFRNGNDYPLTVSVAVQNFRATDAHGVELLPPSQEGGSISYELAQWIKHPTGFITIPPHATENIPFTIVVPRDAEPGGHYAAMLVGTGDMASGSAQELSVSSSVASLFLVRVAGDVLEAGSIQDFFPDKWFVSGQESLMHLRFENRGNVHIEPEGEIVISNMFGRERGRMSMNESNTFGSILPASAKTFSFLWKGESNFFDIGLYRARASLVYGENKEKTAYHSAYFFVFPWIPTIFLVLFLATLFFFVRRYVKRYVESAVRIASKNTADTGKHSANPQRLTVAMLREPIRGKKRRKARQSFVVFVAILLLCVALLGVYFYQIFENERAYQMSVEKMGANTLYIE